MLNVQKFKNGNLMNMQQKTAGHGKGNFNTQKEKFNTQEGNLNTQEGNFNRRKL